MINHPVDAADSVKLNVCFVEDYGDGQVKQTPQIVVVQDAPVGVVGAGQKDQLGVWRFRDC